MYDYIRTKDGIFQVRTISDEVITDYSDTRKVYTTTDQIYRYYYGDEIIEESNKVEHLLDRYIIVGEIGFPIVASDRLEIKIAIKQLQALGCINIHVLGGIWTAGETYHEPILRTVAELEDFEKNIEIGNYDFKLLSKEE